MDMGVIRSLAHLNEIRYDSQTGLVPVIVQDAQTRQVLMQAYANREALKRTFATKSAWFWSRSRQDYWHKGATSGHFQQVQEIRVDCDGDSVLYVVHAAGPACHTGETSCFYRELEYPEHAPSGVRGEQTGSRDASVAPIDTSGEGARGEHVPAKGRSVVQRADTTGHETASVLSLLWNVIDERFEQRPQGAYTTYLFEQGVDKIAKKVGEEAVEVAIAAKNAMVNPELNAELATESADLLYHLLVLWRQAGLTPNDVWQVLQKRSK